MLRERKFLEQRLATLLHETEPLDEFQQDEVVETMNTLQSYHDKSWTMSFSVLSLLMSLAFLADSIMQFLTPFTVKHRGVWKPYLSSIMLISCELAFSACLFFCFIAVHKRGRKREDGFLWTPMSLVLICCSFFSLFMIATLISKSFELNRSWLQLELLWMPLLPVCYCLLIYYVVSLLDKTFKDLEKLKQRKYAFKAI